MKKRKDFHVSGIFQIKKSSLRLPARSPSSLFPFVSELCPSTGPQQTPTRPDVDSCFQALPVNRFWVCILELCAPGHPHLLEVLREAALFTDTAPSCLRIRGGSGLSTSSACRGLEACFPGGKRKTETLPAFLLGLHHWESPD
ncbi:hypothetical protein P7K49_034032, partial [Saguinus oedipus]